MITLVIYGRGGQGIKSAAHIVSIAAFLDGYYVQSQPLYRAERRGAPISAFVRIDKEPILARGYIRDPSLAIIADDSLLMDLDALSISKNTILFINTRLDTERIHSIYNIDNHIITYDLTNLTLGLLNKNVISVALAAAVSRLIGLSMKHLREAVILQLEELSMHEELDKNIRLTEMIYQSIPTLKIEQMREEDEKASVIELEYNDPKVSTCYISNPANSILSEGLSVNKPIIDYEKCTKCMICFVFCPDSAIILKDGYPVINYDLCKGCNICYEECPTDAIKLVKRYEETLNG